MARNPRFEITETGFIVKDGPHDFFDPGASLGFSPWQITDASADGSLGSVRLHQT
jgi:hypothetical protein